MIFKKKYQHKLKTFGSPSLRERAADISVFDQNLRELAQEMLYIMNDFQGIGLAAPQIGESKRLIVIDVPENSRCCQGEPLSPGEVFMLPKMPIALVNPKIIAENHEELEYDEGCLSVPELFAPVMRSKKIVFSAQLLNGETIEYECSGLLSRCLQHEIDHLNGILFTDHLTEENAKTLEFKLFKLESYGKKHNFERSWKK